MTPPRSRTSLLLATMAGLSMAAAPVGQFSDHGDIGGPAIAGMVTHDPALQQYRLSAGGINMWGASDQLHMAWNPIRGDFLVRARIELVGPGVDPHRKAGWIARAGTGADAAYVDACVHGDGLTSIQFRRKPGGITEQVMVPLTGGDVVQLERRGRRYIFSSARYGEPLVTASVEDLDLGDELLVGLFLCSHNAAVREEAVAQDVRLIRPPKEGWVPYRDYIGSHLEILNVHTGRLRLAASAAESFEAPNWMPDGRTLILNVSGPGPDKGRLKTFDLVTEAWAGLETGSAVRNNNDHVLSRDGRRLGISHHSPEDGGRSVIFTLPSKGGPPVRVTPKSPSYLHGWSPDGQWLVYTGGRRAAPGEPEQYDIYKIPVDGGEEVRLTDGPGLDDGAEYSPDGQWIYFCSSRSGRMQLWRMRPDGTGQEMITRDDFNNWFPHVSPDGRWIVFLSYDPEVAPTDHPYYRQCLLRMMPASGGTPRVVAYVFGGQGTINVPSWSPDSTRIAFVSNSDGFR